MWIAPGGIETLAGAQPGSSPLAEGPAWVCEGCGGVFLGDLRCLVPVEVGGTGATGAPNPAGSQDGRLRDEEGEICCSCRGFESGFLGRAKA